MGIDEMEESLVEGHYFPISGDEAYYDGIEEIENEEDYFATDEYGEEE